MKGWIRGLVAAAAWAAASTAFAQDAYPSKPVHLFVPFPPGGAVDIVARTLGDELAKRLGQSIIIENRPGAGGTIAALAAAKSPPDGYTLVVVASGHAIVPFLFPKLQYDVFNDFTPISLLGNSPNLVLVRAEFADEDARRPHCAGAPEAGAAFLRPCRQRHLAASRRRTPQGDGQDRHRRGSLQGRRAGAQRSHGRAHPDHLQQLARNRSRRFRPARCGRSR